MLNFVRRTVTSVAALVVAAPAFAEEAAQGASSGSGLKFLGAGIAIGLAVIGGGMGQGRAAASAFEGIGRNPQSADKLFTPFLIGLALIEFQTIMAFIIAFLLTQ
jgi:F-type H+-transporting ATPase subunit c